MQQTVLHQVKLEVDIKLGYVFQYAMSRHKCKRLFAYYVKFT